MVHLGSECRCDACVRAEEWAKIRAVKSTGMTLKPLSLDDQEELEARGFKCLGHRNDERLVWQFGTSEQLMAFLEERRTWLFSPLTNDLREYSYYAMERL